MGDRNIHIGHKFSSEIKVEVGKKTRILRARVDFGKNLNRQAIWSTKKVMFSSRAGKKLNGSSKRGAGKKKIQKSAPGLLRLSWKLIERESGKVFHYVWKWSLFDN